MRELRMRVEGTKLGLRLAREVERWKTAIFGRVGAWLASAMSSEDPLGVKMEVKARESK